MVVVELMVGSCAGSISSSGGRTRGSRGNGSNSGSGGSSWEV